MKHRGTEEAEDLERSGDRRDRVIGKAKTLPLIDTDDTDLKEEEKALPRINADERGSGKLPELPKLPKSPKLKSKTFETQRNGGSGGFRKIG